MVWVAVLMSSSFGCVDQLAGVVIGLVLGQVEIRLFERRSQWGQLDEGDVVGTSGGADRGRVHSGHDHGAVRSPVDQRASLGQGLGQVGLLHGPDPDARGRVTVDELIGAGVGDDAAPTDHDQVIGGLRHLAHEMAREEHRAAF